MAHRFIACCEIFERVFILRGHEVTHHARHYLSGLLGTQGRKNIERIETDVAESDYPRLQQFVSDSPWKHAAVMDQRAVETEGALGRAADTSLHVDENSLEKNGIVRSESSGRIVAGWASRRTPNAAHQS